MNNLNISIEDEDKILERKGFENYGKRLKDFTGKLH